VVNSIFKKMTKYRKFWKLGRADLATEFFDINKNGQLVVKEGNYQYNLYDLTKKFGTSLEMVFPFVVERRLQGLIDTFNKWIKTYRYRGKFIYHYPMKASQNKELVLPIISEGGNLEVTSANELWMVKRLWEQGQFNNRIRVICNGPKTNYYLSLISELRDKGLQITPIIEDKVELTAINGFKGDIGIRLDPDVKIRAHWDKKVGRFGMSAQEILSLGRIRNLKLLHYHMSKQIEYQEDIIAPLKKALDLYVKLHKVNPNLDMIDIGGGFPVPFEGKPLFSMESVVKRVIRLIQKATDRAGIPNPDILCEWGSYLVAPAQVTIYRILNEKAIEKAVAKKWYIIDGSFMNDLKDTWAIHQKWQVVPVNNMNAKKLSRTWLAGLSCDSDDKYTNGGNYVLLPRLEDLENGDHQYVAILDTGAYQDALASHHCLLSSPAKIIAQNGVLTIARKRESAEEVGKQFGW
jgi:arginine decarboxylase